jgi:citrate synthase
MTQAPARVAPKSGLEGVVAAETVLSHVDGERGILLVRGRTLEELVARHGYEGAVALMWEGFAGEGLTRASMSAALGEARRRGFARLGTWLDAAARRPLGEAVRMCLAALPDDSSPADIAAALPVGIAALLRVRDGAAPTPPDPTLGTAADYLRMARGAPVDARLATALDAYITTVIDNGLSASTFTARIIASTRASLADAVLGAYCAFTGPLHGGAPGPTLDMLDAVAAAGDIDVWLDAKLMAGERLMGFGHRVFKVRDPRADVLRAALQALGPDAGRVAFAAELERRALAALERFKPGRRLQSNVELNAALLLEAVGVPRDAFTPVFALARTGGWIAHALEQQRTGRMIRPTARYIGALPDTPATPA